MEHLGAASLPLTGDEVDRLTALSDSIEIHDGRYLDFLEKQTNL